MVLGTYGSSLEHQYFHSRPEESKLQCSHVSLAAMKMTTRRN